MNRFLLPIYTVAAISLVVIFGVTYSFSKGEETPSGQVSTSFLYSFTDASQVPDAYSTLTRSDNGIATEVRTIGLDPEAIYSVWWVIFNNPQGCSEACNEDDIFDADGNVSPNPEANISILWATSGISSSSGEGTFSAYLPKGRPLGEVLLGLGLQDAQGAEVHLVLRTHGVADLNTLSAQLTSFQPEPSLGGDCEACQDHQFAVHPSQVIVN